MKEGSFKFSIPVGIIVIKEDVALGVEAGNTPKSVSILRTKILDSTSLTRRKDFEMGSFIDIFFDSSEIVNSLNKKKFLNHV